MTTPKPPPLSVVREACGRPSTEWACDPRDLARAYLALVKAARPFAECAWPLVGEAPCGACPECHLAALLPEEDET